MKIAKNLILKLIKIYQKTLSFDHGYLRGFFPHGVCRFKPTCSQYSFAAIERFGLLKGGFMTVKRILKCHPWSKGGNDEVPKS
ncbi:MAG: membrane protein insertion efficiency factor YidD [Candidatus Moranbacteria bacterium]|nr:membrane protein insertion efficiency factor YidD [Candidatus Moranbacteria bacterium]